MKKFSIFTAKLLILLAAGLCLSFLLHRYEPEQKVALSISSNIPQSPALIESIIPPEFQGKLYLFILAGQSNMSGRGTLLPTTLSENPRIFLFGNDYEWHLAAEPIDNARGQVDRVSQDLDAGFSPGMSFATTLLKHNPNLIIGLIPCAKGGSAIAEWERNLSNKTLYGSCLKRSVAASSKGEIAGMLFFQGEADALKPKERSKRLLFPHQWANKFSAFANNFRQDLGRPNLPVVFAQIGSNKAPSVFVNWKPVQEQQKAVKLPSAAMIVTDDLPLKDSVHYTTKSYEIIGKRFADAFWQLTKNDRFNQSLSAPQAIKL
ncbi:sialate O-acetylesterase [Microcoleus sp. FACHB-672]|uniref:sialate O-acetylesterase n=1 Tax=Microcoleus sp. FACHB-672 TaxID=2692825 RepID=UPI0016890C3B|nr:sialate O-acetylesterase [Microcoleus sp. FACHB-672]MBD2040376.1 sialate O-acetylesterase [Microcoleus sp. FACHB-672]